MLIPILSLLKSEIRNDTGSWIDCYITDDIEPGTCRFHPSVHSIVTGIESRVIEFAGEKASAGLPFTMTGGRGPIHLWLHNRNGGVSRIESDTCMGYLEIADAKQTKSKAA